MNIIRLTHANIGVALPGPKAAGLRTLNPYLRPTTAGQVAAVIAPGNLLPVGKQVRKRNGFA